MQNMSFHSQRWENIGTQAINQDHWSFHLYLSQCHLLHNLHSLQKVIHRRNRETTNARNISFRISLRWLIHIINPADKTQLSCSHTLAECYVHIKDYPTNDCSPEALIAQLGEHCTGIAEVVGSSPVQSLIFFSLCFSSVTAAFASDIFFY